MKPLVTARAPGRLDVIGGIADYSGSLVLELPLQEATRVALRRDESGRLTLKSGDRPELSLPLADLEGSYESARAYFRKDSSRAWAAYVAGAFVVLRRERGLVITEGARIEIDSTVPEGRGVASSAALEVATMMAVDAAYGLSLEPRDIALLCQSVENDVVGAPCGVMDQMTSVFGEEDRLLLLLCQPAEIRGNVSIPRELAFWGIDSGVSHHVSGADYHSVRVGAFMGYRLLQEWAGTDWGGYLANLTPSELERKYLERLPERVRGSDFLERFGGTFDPVTTIDPERTYSVRRPTAHPVYENFRVGAFARLLGGDAIENAPLLGELMFQSHASYSACGLGSRATDRLVDIAREFGPSRGIFGAKITGGGSGGTVAILGRHDAEGAVREMAAQYGSETGLEPYVFSGSSPGALKEWRAGRRATGE